MDIKGATVLVTGANRGIGAAFVEQLKKRGAAKIYAAARRAASIDATDVVAIDLDVTDAGQVDRAVAVASDVTLLINNAGISTGTSLISGDEAAVRREMETNFYGPLRLTRGFAGTLAANGGGAIINVASAMSWFTLPAGSAYAASKAAAWVLTDTARLELAAQGTHVVGVYMGLVDTDMAQGMAAPKIAPARLADAALDAVESGTTEVLADDWTRMIRSGLPLDPKDRYEQIFAALGA